MLPTLNMFTHCDNHGSTCSNNLHIFIIDRLKRTWNKKSGRWAVVPVKEKKNYNHIDEILMDALTARIEDKGTFLKAKDLPENDPRRISKWLAPQSPQPTADIAKKQFSRFN